MQHELLRKKDYAQPYLEYGTVREEEDGLKVETPLGVYPALTAASCLVVPRHGDYVLATTDADWNCYILSILARDGASASPREIVLEGDSALRVNRGTLTISAEDEVSVVSDKLSLTARTGCGAFEAFSFMGTSLSAQVGNIRTVAGKVEHIFERLTEKLIDAFRFVKDHEEVQTGSSRYLVDTNLTMHSKNAMHVAEEIVTINGGQVHLG